MAHHEVAGRGALVKRSPLPPRTTYLPRSTKPIRSRKKDPAKRRFAGHRDPNYELFVESLPCLVCLRWPVDAAHVVPRSLGSDDRKNLVPLCRSHHDEQEGHTPEFEAKYGVDLTAAAVVLDAEYETGGFA